ncbi:hypothetical protein HRR83_007571 [Exophiala dermatitidis]|nr:hypothetical protein HRR75_006602 [Exophiala dermatitidis]KAJ4510039.1 hypothetical protein HRR74_007191 [Exophiala dermatitidis]KAJ4542807.1 hypothetical protein HRR78_006896 [Exophiala dermatitidis]KAJ4548521.1 hypothetical protein HRR76_001116 [Exophiala dermatitidis]KAJ4565850.1 hypothetical protein HRR81_007517 [Exophiala dermatitidis]
MTINVSQMAPDPSAQQGAGDNVPPEAAPGSTQSPLGWADEPMTNPAATSWAPAAGGPSLADNERAYQEAIRLSLQDAKKTPSALKPDVPDDLVFSLNNQLDVLDDQDGDTVIFIGAPPQMPEQSDKEYEYVRAHFERVHVVKSTTLKLMGKHSKFTADDLFGPKSVRVERKLRKLGVLTALERKKGRKFKYHIDLRPADEDEEAIVLLTELTCTKGVLTWHQAAKEYAVSPHLVLGHDSYGVPSLSTDPNDTSTENEKVSGAKDAETQDKDADRPASPVLAPEYSPVRHRAAIERVLHAICGNDPKLDSAPKVWTYFGVAKYLGCAQHERVSGWITAWIYDERNVNFIQSNPEVAYRIGMGIRSPILVQDAFSILVGEKALINVYGEHDPKILSPLVKSVQGRKLELLDDDERNRIDHAAAAFVIRIRGFVNYICKDMGWLRKSRYFAILDDAVGKTPEDVALLDSTKLLVKEYIRSRIYYVLCQDQPVFPELKGHHASSASAVRPVKGMPSNVVYNPLQPPIKWFTKTLWIALQRTDLGVGFENTNNVGTTGAKANVRRLDAFRKLYRINPEDGIRTISREDVLDRVKEVNRVLRRGTPHAQMPARPYNVPGSFDDHPSDQTSGLPSFDRSTEVWDDWSTASPMPHNKWNNYDPSTTPPHHWRPHPGMVNMADITPINPTNLLHQLTDEFAAMCSGILYPTHLFHETGLLPTGLFDNLVCLDTNEFRYLPLWMPEGLDDGTGGVFDECPVPNMDDPDIDSGSNSELAIKTSLYNKGRKQDKGKGRSGYHTNSEDSFSDIASQAISTVGKASKVATDGTETVKSLSTTSTASVGVGGAGPSNTTNVTTAPNHHTYWHSGRTVSHDNVNRPTLSDSDGGAADSDSHSSDSDTQHGVSLLASSSYDLIDFGDAPTATTTTAAASTAAIAATASITTAMATTSLNDQQAQNDGHNDNDDEDKDHDFGNEDNNEGFDENEDYDNDDGTEGGDKA